MADILAEISPDEARESYETGKEVKEHVDKERKKAKAKGIVNVVSPRLQKHKYGPCIAIFSILSQLVLFVCMVIYFKWWSCTLTFDFVDGDWDASVYDSLFADNIKMCDTYVYMPLDIRADERRDWYTSPEQWEEEFGSDEDDDNEADTIYVDWLPDKNVTADYALPFGEWASCHITGHPCSDYHKGQPCGTPECDDKKPCFGMVSLKYATCKTTSEAIPLATGYLVYANMAVVTFCLSCFFLISLCKGEGWQAVRDMRYQIVGVIGDREVPKLDDHKGDVEMSAK